MLYETNTHVSKISIVDIDECESNPCQNGGTCLDGEDGFMCECPEGFEGQLCDQGRQVYLS